MANGNGTKLRDHVRRNLATYIMAILAIITAVTSWGGQIYSAGESSARRSEQIGQLKAGLSRIEDQMVNSSKVWGTIGNLERRTSSLEEWQEQQNKAQRKLLQNQAAIQAQLAQIEQRIDRLGIDGGGN